MSSEKVSKEVEEKFLADLSRAKSETEMMEALNQIPLPPSTMEHPQTLADLISQVEQGGTRGG